MSKYNSEKAISITKWQALFNHEGSVWETDYASVRTARVDGAPSDDLTIKRKIATYVSEIKEQELQYTHQMARSAQHQAHRPRPTASDSMSVDDYESFLDSLGLDNVGLDVVEMVSQAEMETDLVGPQDIDLIEITDRSRIHVDVFPLTFRCRRCGHVQMMSGTESDLMCPECNQKLKTDAHARASRMIQESIIFVCPHCASIEGLAPWGKGARDTRDGVFECPKGCGGHLHFYRWDRLGAAYWRCSKCNYIERPVRRNCGCSIYDSGEDSDTSQIWAMRLNPTSASNTYALQKTFVEVNKQDITLALLEVKRGQDMAAGKRSWRLEELLESLDGFTRGIFRQTYDLVDAFMVNDIESSTVVYGYTTRVTSNRPISESERIPRCFSQRGGRYRAYLIKSIGRGLVLEFDKDKIAQVVQRGVPPSNRRDYDSLVDEELEALENGIFQDNLDHPEAFPVASAMHAIAHALFSRAADEAGLEVFGVKALLRDAALLLFERQDVGDGGIVQLTSGQQFLRLANSMHSQLSSCGQGCEKGCLSCTFINDFNCSPFLETECNRWYPGNSFLDRGLAALIIGPTKR
jgi:hypothetical protein